jgi:uncharacterized protein (DUF3820 family)
MGERLGDPEHVSILRRPQVIDFAAARAYVLPIGRYAGRTLADIGETARGLGYLAWLLHARDYQREASGRVGSANERETTAMLRAYLTAPTVAAEVVALKRQGIR